MHKVFVRKVTQQDEKGIVASERLDITVDLENRRCGFGFTSRVKGIADIRGTVAFTGDDNDNELTHSSGDITRDAISNFNAFSALLERLDVCCAAGMTDQEILGDSRVKLIIKNNGFKELKFD